MEPQEALPLRVRVALEEAVMNAYSSISKAPGLKPLYQMHVGVLPRTHGGKGVWPLSRNAVGVVATNRAAAGEVKCYFVDATKTIPNKRNNVLQLEDFFMEFFELLDI